MSGKWSTPKRCNCKDADGKELGRTCPKLSGRHHGTVGYTTRIPTTGGVRELRRFGFATKSEADKAAGQVWDLIKLGGADAGTQQGIGDLIFKATARGGQLPSVEDVRRRLGLGLDPAQPGVTVAAWLDSWLAGKRRTKRASTVRGYESHIRVHINPVIGDLPLERLNVGHLEAVLAAVPGSAGTRHRVLATLRAALNAALKQRQITWNPSTGIELEPENPAEGGRWTPAEAARFLAYTADDPMGLMFRVMVLRGCRRAELCGFRWSFADLDQGVLTVKRPILQLGGKLHEEATAKSRAGDRLVFLDTETAQLLREHRKAQLAARLRAGEAWQDDDLIFCQADGRPWNPDHVSKRFKKLAAQAGVPVIKLHEGGRHTGNSLMRDAGVDQEVRMREVRHADNSDQRPVHARAEEAHLAAAEQTAALARKAARQS